jgi:hypothetical protein
VKSEESGMVYDNFHPILSFQSDFSKINQTSMKTNISTSMKTPSVIGEVDLDFAHNQITATLDYIKNEVKAILQANHSVKDRIDNLLELNYSVIVVRENTCWKYPDGIHKLVYLYFSKCGFEYYGTSPWGQGEDTSSASIGKSLYIQISGYYGRFKNVKYSYCTYFVEVPEKNLTQFIRKRKLKKIGKNQNN